MTIDLRQKNGEIHEMKVEEFSRWMCLVEALDFIYKHAEEMKINLEMIIGVNAIDHYIKERYESMLHDVKCEYRLGNI
jgi:hypothetical protein